jgi:hypothetical protein
MLCRPCVHRIHARQPIVNYCWVPNRRQRFHFVVYYGAHSPLFGAADLHVRIISALP